MITRIFGFAFVLEFVMKLRTDTQEPDMETAMKVVYQWNYEPELEELRRLYVKGTERVSYRRTLQRDELWAVAEIVWAEDSVEVVAPEEA